MTLSERFAAEHPQAFFAEASEPQALTGYLRKQGWIAPTREVSSLERAGQGNMNLVLRVQLDDRSTFILKQSRPWAEKYPSVAAPLERAEIEAEFYRRTAKVEALAARMPRLLQADASAHILMLEDLCPSRDLSTLCSPGAVLEASVLEALVDYLAVLHSQFRQPHCGFRLDNRAMRALNAEHTFTIDGDPLHRPAALDDDRLGHDRTRLTITDPQANHGLVSQPHPLMG